MIHLGACFWLVVRPPNKPSGRKNCSFGCLHEGLARTHTKLKAPKKLAQGKRSIRPFHQSQDEERTVEQEAVHGDAAMEMAGDKILVSQILSHHPL